MARIAFNNRNGKPGKNNIAIANRSANTSIIVRALNGATLFSEVEQKLCNKIDIKLENVGGDLADLEQQKEAKAAKEREEVQLAEASGVTSKNVDDPMNPLKVKNDDGEDEYSDMMNRARLSNGGPGSGRKSNPEHLNEFNSKNGKFMRGDGADFISRAHSDAGGFAKREHAQVEIGRSTMKSPSHWAGTQREQASRINEVGETKGMEDKDARNHLRSKGWKTYSKTSPGTADEDSPYNMDNSSQSYADILSNAREQAKKKVEPKSTDGDWQPFVKGMRKPSTLSNEADKLTLVAKKSNDKSDHLAAYKAHHKAFAANTDAKTCKYHEDMAGEHYSAYRGEKPDKDKKVKNTSYEDVISNVRSKGLLSNTEIIVIDPQSLSEDEKDKIYSQAHNYIETGTDMPPFLEELVNQLTAQDFDGVEDDGNLSNGGPGSGRHKGLNVGDWVVHPKTNKRGVVSHVYEDNKNEKGRLVQVDYNNLSSSGGGNLQTNHREHDVKKSKDQTSKWNQKRFESPQTYPINNNGKTVYVTIPNSQSYADIIANAKSKESGHLVTEKDGTQHLPTHKNGKFDARLAGGAWAALHDGYRGNKYEGPDKDKAIAKLKKLYKSQGMDVPSE